MSNRRSPLVRSSVPPRFVLMPRDWAFIQLLWRYRVLTRVQLQRLTGMPCVTRINTRLSLIWGNEYIQRRKVATPSGTTTIVYSVGPAAVTGLAEELGCSAREVRARIRADFTLSPLLVGHDLQANDAIIALLEGLTSAGVSDLTWFNSHEAFDPFDNGRHTVRPDFYLRFVASGLQHAYFGEWDNGTTPQRRIGAKITNYGQYRSSGAYTRKYGLASFRILFLAPSRARVQNLRATARESGVTGCWFAVADAVLADPAPTKAIWLPARSDAPRSLIEVEGASTDVAL